MRVRLPWSKLPTSVARHLRVKAEAEDGDNDLMDDGGGASSLSGSVVSGLEGAPFDKDFPGFGVFRGTVVYSWKDGSGSFVFHVRYPDGDEEDLGLQQIAPLLARATESLAAKFKDVKVNTSKGPY